MELYDLKPMKKQYKKAVVIINDNPKLSYYDYFTRLNIDNPLKMLYFAQRITTSKSKNEHLSKRTKVKNSVMKE
jgi:hypothetical protein